MGQFANRHQRKRTRSHARLLTRSVSILVACVLAGCSGYTGPRSVSNEDPAVKIPEIHKAIERGDKSVVPQLVHDLDSDDAAVRLHAIGALRKLTGEHFDYDWTQNDRALRRPAVEKWQAYLQSAPSSGK
jgi:hypothetical protein